MKKTFNIILTILLLSFSFYYTNVASNYLKNKDPIMIQIKNQENKYYKKAINAKVVDNTIIPGIKGISINVEDSYRNMKKINNYSENLLVFNYLKPTVSLEDNKDKLIIQGNPTKRNISILLKIDDINILKKTLKEIDNNNINFIFTNNFLTENKQYLENLDNNIVTEINSNVNNLSDYCYTEDLNIQESCSNLPIIVPTLITHDYYYSTYQVLENGKIIAYQLVNDKSIQDLNILLSGIRNLNYNIVTLDDLVKE